MDPVLGEFEDHSTSVLTAEPNVRPRTLCLPPPHHTPSGSAATHPPTRAPPRRRSNAMQTAVTGLCTGVSGTTSVCTQSRDTILQRRDQRRVLR